MSRPLVFFASLAIISLPAVARAQEPAKKPKVDPGYIKVEVRGVLKVSGEPGRVADLDKARLGSWSPYWGQDAATIATGITIATEHMAPIDVYFGGDKALIALAKKLNGQSVVVSGDLRQFWFHKANYSAWEMPGATGVGFAPYPVVKTVILATALKSAEPAPKPKIGFMSVAWNSKVSFTRDMVGGKDVPCLTGTVYPGRNAGDKIDAKLKVQLFVNPPEDGVGHGTLLESWQFDPATLKRIAKADARGLSYPLALPWGTYREDICRVVLLVQCEVEAKDGKVVVKHRSSVELEDRAKPLAPPMDPQPAPPVLLPPPPPSPIALPPPVPPVPPSVCKTTLTKGLTYRMEVELRGKLTLNDAKELIITAPEDVPTETGFQSREFVWRLDLPASKKLHKIARRLAGKDVILTGTCLVLGIDTAKHEVGLSLWIAALRPERIVRVTRIDEAGE